MLQRCLQLLEPYYFDQIDATMDFLRNEFQQKGINLNEQQAGRFSDYYHLLVEWNKKINLTRIIEEKDVVTRHFLDSLEALHVINKYLEPPYRVIDIGSGAGFPGIPIAIMENNAHVHLVEATRKKATFLDHIVHELNMTNVSVHNTRAEILGHDPSFRETFDVAIARGVSHIFASLEYLLPFCRKGGLVTILTKPRLGQTIGHINEVMESLGGSIVEYRESKEPDQPVRRGVVIGKKQRSTHADYPRRPGAIYKKPLQPKAIKTKGYQ